MPIIIQINFLECYEEFYVSVNLIHDNIKDDKLGLDTRQFLSKMQHQTHIVFRNWSIFVLAKVIFDARAQQLSPRGERNRTSVSLSKNQAATKYKNSFDNYAFI